MKQEVFLECAMAVDASGDSAGRAVGDRTAARRRNTTSSSGGGGDAAPAPADVLLLDETPVGTPCSDFLAIGE
ncbi:hypothetical protein HPB50_013938 [Hyalomma asiaticum]|uniref:Uncharacterized protein n=1 Tax=Hyalomma asiaticum TaxID=266040 RepID=A0ACB7T2G0_HYAAI|nr:hypothetical protein HPB50_013938 [Hyalomma asiaticum]